MVKEKECKGCHEVLHVLDFWTGGGITIFKHLLYRREKSNLNHLKQYNRTVNSRSSVLSFFLSLVTSVQPIVISAFRVPFV